MTKSFVFFRPGCGYREKTQQNLNKRVKSGSNSMNSLQACVFKFSCSHLCGQIQSTHTCRHFLIENASTEKDMRFEFDCTSDYKFVNL